MDAQVDPLKIFVGGLSWETDEVKLKAHFMQFGHVTSVEIKRDAEDRADPNAKRHRGFGFVTFEKPESVSIALSQGLHMLDNKKVDPKPAEVKPAGPRVFQSTLMSGDMDGSNDEVKKKIFVGGISSSTTEDDVRTYFESILGGGVAGVEFKFDKATQRMRGFGFVTFDSVDHVESVCKNPFHNIKGKSVEVKKAQPRHLTPSGQAYAQMRRAQEAGYTGAYGYNDAGYGRANEQQQYQHYYSNQYYGYATPQQTAAAATYGQYSNPTTNYSYDPSGYSRAQATGGERQDTQAYYQQQPNPYGGMHTTQQLAATYGQDTSSYTGRAAYTTGHESYTQQAGGYAHSTGQQQQQLHYGGAAGTPSAGSYGH